MEEKRQHVLESFHLQFEMPTGRHGDPVLVGLDEGPRPVIIFVRIGFDIPSRFGASDLTSPAFGCCGRKIEDPLPNLFLSVAPTLPMSRVLNGHESH